MAGSSNDWIPDYFPLPSDALPTCGNRKDLPKKQRVHELIYMGRDVRFTGEKGYLERDIYVCVRCGHDVSKRIRGTN